MKFKEENLNQNDFFNFFDSLAAWYVIGTGSIFEVFA